MILGMVKNAMMRRVRTIRRNLLHVLVFVCGA
jgi:hypothetical protein